MASKFTLPLIFGVGAAAILLMPKKKESVKKSVDKPGKDQDSDIVSSGVKLDWEWRVRRVPGDKGFAEQYYGEVKSPTTVATWSKAHVKGRDSPDKAKYLAWEYISKKAAANGEPTFDWESARKNNQLALREKFPDVSLGILETGNMMHNDIKCQWAIMDVMPPIEDGAYAGFVICPSTGEQVSLFSDSIKSIKEGLNIPSKQL